MRVAVVRGGALNKNELQMFEPLRPEIDVFAIGEHPALPDVRTIDIPVVLLRSAGGAVGELRPQRRLGRLAARYFDAERLIGLEKAVAGCDILHGAETFISATEQLAEVRARDGGKLVISVFENIPFLYEDDARFRERKRRVIAAADRFIAYTPMAARALVTEGVDAGRIEVIPGAVDLDLFRPLPRDTELLADHGIGEDDPVVLYCGRVIREKGLVNLLIAFQEVLRAHPRATLLILGSGPESSRLAAAAERLGVSDRLRMIPAQPYADLPRWYSISDVFVLPSLSTPYWLEQFGFVLLEALATGKAILTTRSGSIPEVVRDAAVLVEPYDPAGLASALSGLLADPGRRAKLGAAGRALAEQTYGARRVAEQLREVYRSLA